MIDNLQDVIDNDLCCNCGLCEGICPENALKLKLDYDKGVYQPIINETACNDCKICYMVCPGHEVNFKALNKYFFSKEVDDLRMGVFSDCYIGHSQDEKVRYDASSGGMVSSLLIYALEQGIIQGALVTRMKKNNPLEPEPFIARSREEILEAAKSKYSPVPVNKLIQEIQKAEGERFAVVGLPCHLHGIRKAEIMDKSLEDKIILHLGLFCSHTDNFRQIYDLLDKLKINREDLVKINFRGQGWPGKILIKLKNGDKINLPFQEAMNYHTLWVNTLFRCLFCCDLTAELSDVSFGDPWLDEIIKEEKIGKNLIIARTAKSNTLLSDAAKKGYLDLHKISPDKIKKSGMMMESKKQDIKVRFYIRRFFGKELPLYDTELITPGPINYLKGFFVYFNTVVSSKNYLRKVLIKLIPLENYFMKKLIGDK